MLFRSSRRLAGSYELSAISYQLSDEADTFGMLPKAETL
jgi:hypothetical protein